MPWPAAGSLLAALAVAPAQAEDQQVPLWEIGLGVVGLRLPYYRGSDQYGNLVLPLPYPVYRGEILRSDREGIRGILFSSDRVTLNLSLGASLPVSSKSSDTRAGMPDLKPEVEIGPALNWVLWRGHNPGTRLTATMPVRAAISIQWPPRNLGWISDPSLTLDLTDPTRFPHWHLGLQQSVLFTTQHLNGYYYSVAPAYATPTRPAYDAPGGYAGLQSTATMSRRFGQIWVGTFARFDSLHGAVFQDSPQIRAKTSLYGGLGIAYILKQSSVRVPRTEADY